MKAATKRILCYILLCLFVLTTITASLTFGRYTSEKASDNDYKGDIEYILGDAIIINTIEEFFQAIENGYSNIQLGDELDNPLIISGGMSGVVSDLIIDLNGHEIQRNNREPILDVKDGINLTIIDTSADKTGSLYNPVGSVLKVSGGTLTAAAGIFESGPRSGKRDDKGGRVEIDSNYDEYAVAEGSAWSAPSGGGFDSQADIKPVQLFKRPESGSGKYEPAGDALLPIIAPKDAKTTGTNLAVNGNMYFDENSKVGYPVDGTKIITKDTYLYYTFESENMQFTDTAASGSAEYYYQYYVKGDESNGTVNFDYATNQKKKDENNESDTRVPVTVYVYNSVKGSADKNNSYAAINMASGNLYARAGYYYSYFGEKDTYCVNATGGYMAVTQGQFNAFGNGVGIQCAYDSEAGANEYLNITQGTFYSQDGDTIRVSGGKLEIGTADITKDATDSADDWFANGSAINVSGGGVTVNNSLEIFVEGSGCAGISSDGAGAVTANKNCTITLKGDKNVGIYSGETDGTSQPVIIGSQSSGEVTANITLAEGSSKSYGIYSAGGNVYIAGGGGSATFTLSGTELQGIYSTGGSVNIANGTAGGEVTFTINSDNVYSGSDPTASDAPYSRAIYSNGGNINIGTNGKTIATFNLDGSYLQGIHANGGNVKICTADVADTSATFNLGSQAEKGATNITGIATGTAGGAAAIVNIGSNSSTFTLNAYGKTMSGIFAQGGAVNLLGEATFVLDGSGMGGIYSVGGAVVLGAQSGAKPAKFTLTGSSMRGISVSGEASSATFNGVTTVNMSDGINDSYGIAASQGTLTFNNSVNITAEGVSAAAYGIYATGAGSVVDIGGETNITYIGSATSSNAIHNVGGTVAISATTKITFNGGAKNSNGIYNGAEQNIAGGTIGLGYQLNDNNELAKANDTAEFTVDLSEATKSTGIYSADGTINISGSKYSSTINESPGAELDNASIYATAGEVNFAAAGEGGVTLTSDCLGIVIRGTLNFDSGNVKINTPNGTAIYVYQGSLTAAENVTVNITSGINGNGWGVEGAERQTNIYNGVFVNGGSLTASGTFNVTHTGVANDDVGNGMNDGITPGYEYRDFKIKSFAVRVESLPDSLIDTTVAINKANIQSIIKEENGKIIGGGGGLYVSGGTVTLGNENSRQGDISITTQGTSYSGEYTVAGHANSNWKAPVPITGGHAVQVNGGELTIYNGTYKSALGNGILVSNGEATIQYGSFIGADPMKNDARMDVAGAAANYGFKMYGGEVVINDGTFGGNGSGAFVMGTGTDSGTAVANIYGGSFNVTGQAGFSVYQYANVIFGNDSNDIIEARGDAAGLVIETTPNGDAPTVTINAGTFESIRNSNGDGVWYGNGSAKLTITGGKFIGSSRAGLCIDNATQDSHKIVITGGTFEGSEAGLWYDKSAAVDDGLLIMGGTFEGDSGVYLAQNPWSQTWWGRETNNVAIVAGTFTGDSKAIGDASDNDVKVGDVLTMHIVYTDGNTTYYHYGYAAGVNGNAGGGRGGAVNDIGTSVTLTMQPK